jgi:hypothetical protein
MRFKIFFNKTHPGVLPFGLKRIKRYTFISQIVVNLMELEQDTYLYQNKMSSNNYHGNRPKSTASQRPGHHCREEHPSPAAKEPT